MERIKLSKDGLYINFVEKQTEDICMIAVAKDYEALQYVHNITKDICEIAKKHENYKINKNNYFWYVYNKYGKIIQNKIR